MRAAHDPDRRPADVLTLFGVAPGQTVAELMTGRGYYAEILAHAVGPGGKVYAQNNQFVIDKFAREPMAERLQRLQAPQLVHVVQELDDLQFPKGQLDAVLLVLFYHDTYWMGVDRAALNRAVHRALKPGGIYGVIDHHAQAGSGDRDVKTLHRVDATLVRAEIEAAGFRLDQESDLLRHPEDARTLNVFDESIRGKTDRFVFRFVKAP